MVKRILKFFGWSLSCLFFLVGVVNFTTIPYSAISFILWGAIAFPPLWKLTKRYGKAWNIIGRILTFMLAAIISAQSTEPIKTAAVKPIDPPSVTQQPPVESQENNPISKSELENSETTPKTDQAASGDTESGTQANSRAINKFNFPGEWMLTVDSGELLCITHKMVVFITPDGTEYGVNGTAKGFGYPDIKPIWKNHPTIEGAKIDIGSLIEEGLKLCQ